MPASPDSDALRAQYDDLLAAYEAIRSGRVDAVLLGAPDREELYTRTSADRPYRVIIEEMGEGAATLSDGNALLYVNRRLCELLGRERSDLLGVAVGTLVPERQQARLDGLLAVSAGVTGHAELDLLHRDGSRVPVLATVTGLDLDEVSVRCMIVADLTSRQRDQRQIALGHDALRQRAEELERSNADLSRANEALAGERQRLQEAQRLGQLGSFGYDLATGAFQFSEQIYRIWGLPVGADLAGLRTSMIHPEDVEKERSQLDLVRESGRQHSVQYRIVRPDGALRHLRVELDVVRDDSGAPVALYGTQLDITDITNAQRAAVEASEMSQAVLSATPDYSFVTDLETGAVIYSTPGKTLLGLTEAELLQFGDDALDALVHGDDQQRVGAANEAAMELDDGQVIQILYRARHRDGPWHWLSRRVTPFQRAVDGQVKQVLAVMRDVTDAVQAEETLQHSALHDPLTGLPNRALLMDRLQAALARTRQAQREVAILFCDLDGFKRVNDLSGHAAGDEVLIATASRLQGLVRAQDTIARVGGDEFVILVEPWDRLPEDRRHETVAETGEAGAAGVGPAYAARQLATSLASRIAETLRAPITVRGVDHVISVSIGITFAGPSITDGAELATADSVLQDADAAMYRAKSGGKDRFEIFEHRMRTDIFERAQVGQELRRALKRLPSTTFSMVPRARQNPTSALTAEFQPVVSAGSGRLIGFEALARLKNASGEQVRPEVFIQVAEASGLIRPLGLAMLDLACGQLAAWLRRRPDLSDLTMAVNVSALQVHHASFAEDVREALRRHDLAPHHLILELTESALLNAAHSALTSLQGMRRDGIGIAIDDFGTGYASLRYLATLPVSAVKVDQSFTARLTVDDTSRKIVLAVIGLAADLELDCIVEGVETLEQLAALPLDVQMQGWLTGRPQPGPDVDLDALLAAEGSLRDNCSTVTAQGPYGGAR